MSEDGILVDVYQRDLLLTLERFNVIDVDKCGIFITNFDGGFETAVRVRSNR